MAVLIPQVVGRGLSSDAERKLARRFREEVPDDTVVMHSVGLVRHRDKRWAECDFVVVGPDGVFCIEVKGGRVRRVDGEWTFTDRHGHVSSKYEGPFDQAGGAAGALHNWLATSGLRRTNGARFQVGYGVMTPDCELDLIGPDTERRLTYDSRDLDETLDGFLERLGRYWQDRQDVEGLAGEEIETLQQAIRPDFEASLTRSLVVGHVEEDLVRLTREQESAVDGLVDNERLIVTGAAGTGKSMLAAAEATRLADDDRRVLLLCRTGALAEALRGATHPSAVVLDSFSYLHALVRDAGLLDRVPDASVGDKRDVFLPELAMQALRHDASAPEFDVLVLDEGQDLTSGELLPVLDLALRGGFESGEWRLFQDPNQDIFGAPRAESWELLRSGSPARYRLTVNCRNTRQIVQWAQLLSGTKVTAESAVTGPEPRHCERWGDPLAQRVLAQLAELLGEGVRAEDVVVLVYTRRQRDAVLASATDILSREPRRGRSLVSTIAGFKGLDSTVVVLAGIPGLDEPRHRQAAYIGATRAKVLLRVVLPDTARRSFDRRVKEFAQSVVAANSP